MKPEEIVARYPNQLCCSVSLTYMGGRGVTIRTIGGFKIRLTVRYDDGSLGRNWSGSGCAPDSLARSLVLRAIPIWRQRLQEIVAYLYR